MISNDRRCEDSPALPSVARTVQFAACALALAVASLVPVGVALAHGGGTPRLTNAQAGPYGVYAWTEPEPLRQGETHLTIGVTVPADNAAQTGQVEAAITDADVIITYTSLDGVGETIEVKALPQEALGAVYYEADAKIPSPGRWQVAIAVGGTEGSGEVSFMADVAPPRQTNFAALAAGGILLLGAVTGLAWRARGNQTAESRTSRARREVPGQ